MTSGRVRQSISLQPSSAGAAEVVGAEVEVLHVGAERAVEDDDPLGDGVEVGLPWPSELSRLPVGSVGADRGGACRLVAASADWLDDARESRHRPTLERSTVDVAVARRARRRRCRRCRASAESAVPCRARLGARPGDARRGRLRGQGRPDARRAPAQTGRRSSPSASATRRARRRPACATRRPRSPGRRRSTPRSRRRSPTSTASTPTTPAQAVVEGVLLARYRYGALKNDTPATPSCVELTLRRSRRPGATRPSTRARAGAGHRPPPPSSPATSPTRRPATSRRAASPSVAVERRRRRPA